MQRWKFQSFTLYFMCWFCCFLLFFVLPKNIFSYKIIIYIYFYVPLFCVFFYVVFFFIYIFLDGRINFLIFFLHIIPDIYILKCNIFMHRRCVYPAKIVFFFFLNLTFWCTFFVYCKICLCLCCCFVLSCECVFVDLRMYLFVFIMCIISLNYYSKLYHTLYINATTINIKW